LLTDLHRRELHLLMGAKAGRKGGRSYNILTYGAGWWRKYLDKTRRKSAKKFAIDEQDIDYHWDAKHDPECICGLIEPNKAACRCGCGLCCPEDTKL
jgi:hypothetical protein